MTHGWPGSVIELLETIGPLTDPTAHGGSAEDAFDLVLPSCPATASPASRPSSAGTPAAPRRPGPELMHRLGYTRYVAQGGDVGAPVTDAMGRQAPEGLVGIHMNLLVTVLAGALFRQDTEEERRGRDAIATFRATGFGYFLEQATRPQTIGYALLDSPVALAAWMLDHDTDSYYKISRAFVDGKPVGQPHPRPHPRQHHAVLADRHRRLGGPRRTGRADKATARAAGQAPPPVTVPVGFTTFPGEIVAAPRSWVEQAYPSLAYFNEVDKGGHFAAWEEPELFAGEVRAAFRQLR